jgi:hypothetical protein
VQALDSAPSPSMRTVWTGVIQQSLSAERHARIGCHVRNRLGAATFPSSAECCLGQAGVLTLG